VGLILTPLRGKNKKRFYFKGIEQAERKI